MPEIKPTQLPDKIRLCLIDSENGKPMPSVPVQLLIETNSFNSNARTHSAGLLASNHTGYLSFNLTKRKQQYYDVITGIHLVIPIEPPISINLTEQVFASTLAQAAPSSPPPQEVLPITLPGSLADLRNSNRGLNSIEDPDIADWLLAPGSFGADALPAIGENGCEVLLPSHSAERIVRFHQLVRSARTGESSAITFSPAPSYDKSSELPEPGWPRNLHYRTGELHHYELIWIPINHGLGKVLYSLTLAPCEAVRLAVLEWSRTDDAARNESTTLSDSLDHSLNRDRTVEEVVNATLRERQSGESFLGGMAGVGGYGGGMGGGGMGGGGMGMPGGGGSGGPGGSGGEESGGSSQGGGQQSGQNWGVTGSHSLGYAMANSSGDRDVDVETTQNLVDEIAQASHLIRDLRSTVIVQSNQAERESVQTRIVRNHNHSHALTLLYYEVVRHYLVRCLKRQVKPVIFIKYPLLNFDEATAYKYRYLLKDNLLTPHLASHFDALEEKITATNNDLQFFNNGRITDFITTVTAAGDSIDNLDRMHLYVLSSGRREVLDLRFPFLNVRPFTTTTHSLPNTDLALRYRDILQLGLLYSVEGDGEYRERADIQGFEVKAAIELDGVIKVFDLLASTTYYRFENTSTFWQIPNRKRDAGTLTATEHRQNQKISELMTQLLENRHYYNALIWLNESPQRRAARFEHYELDGMSLIERIDNRPVDVVGDYVVFPLAENPSMQTARAAQILSERIISMPTRGAFAEAKLSHCNASEIIDDTRFWDWQMSPCPDDPTSISPINMGSRRGTSDVSSSSLPASGIGITSPETAPEPVGLREVMELLRTPDVFRDMSGIEQLGPLLEKLVEVAGEVEKARIGATTTLATAGREQNAPQGTSSRAATPAMGTQDRRSMAQVAQRQLGQLRDIGAITPQQYSDLSYRSAERAFVSGEGSQSGFVDDPTVRQLIQSGISRGDEVELRQGMDLVQLRRSTGAGETISGSDIPDASGPFWGPLSASDRWFQGWMLLYNFDIDSIDLKPEHQDNLNRLVAMLEWMEQYRLEAIQGRASETGSEENNQRLADERGSAAASYLAERGIPLERIPALPSPPLGSADPIRVVSGMPEDAVNRSVLLFYRILIPRLRFPTPTPPRPVPGITRYRDWAIRVVLTGSLHEGVGVSLMDVHIKNCATGEYGVFAIFGLGAGINAGGSLDIGWTSFQTIYPVTLRDFNACNGFYYTFGFEFTAFGRSAAYLRLPYLVESAIDLGGTSLGTGLGLEGGGYIDVVELFDTGDRHFDYTPCPAL